MLFGIGATMLLSQGSGKQLTRSWLRNCSRPLWKGSNELFKEMKKAHGGKHAPGLPENVAGANGEDEICEKFRSAYSELYNSASSEDKMNVIKIRVDANIVGNASVEPQVSKITMEVVKLAIVTMKKNKGDLSKIYT